MLTVRLLLFAVFSLLILPSAFALEAPSVSSETHPGQSEWYNDGAVEFEWSSVSGSSGYSYDFDLVEDTVPDEIADTSGTSASFGSRLDGIWYFHVRAVNASGGGPTAHYKVQIDKTGSQPPQNVDATALPNGYIELTWKEPEDNLSGVKDYKIYRRNERDFDIRYSTVMAENYTETSFTDTDLNMYQGVAYFYKLVAFDKAGNQSQVSPQVFAVTAKRCDLSITLGVPDFTNSDTLEVKVNSSGGNMYNARVDVLPEGDENTVTIAEEQSEISSISADYGLSQMQNGSILVILRAKDKLLGDSCDQNKTVGYDTSMPEGSLAKPEHNETLSGSYALNVAANDTGAFKSGIGKVEFYEKPAGSWEKIGEASGSGSGTFTYDWNTLAEPNGRRLLKAAIYDKAGNKVETGEITIEIYNKETLRASATSAIDKAVSAKNGAVSFKSALKAKGVDAPKFYELLALADENLSAARRYSEKEDYARAEDFAKRAEKDYRDSLLVISVSTYKTDEYVYNKEQLAAAFQSAGLGSTYRDEAEALIKNNIVSRTLEINEVKDGNQTYYIASILVKFTNKDANILNIQLIESIPKELMGSADGFYSDSNYAILKSDPVVGFSVGDVGTNRTAEIFYTLKNPLTLGEADLLISEHRINKYAMPPVVLLGTTGVSSSIISPPFSLALPNLLPNIDLGGDSFLILIGGGVIVLLLVVIVVLLFVLMALLRKKDFGGQAKPKFSK